MNTKIKNFQLKIDHIVNEQKQSIIKNVNDSLESFKTIEFSTFTNESPYSGDFKNKIFFTYCNHYKANSGMWMSVGSLNHPHLNYEDRGYIKGVVTDLDGYMKLKNANYLNHNFVVVSSLYMPKFRKSINKNNYIDICANITKDAKNELDSFVEDQKAILNSYLKGLTGCSLLSYLQNI